MTIKFCENSRRSDIECAMHVIRQAKKHRGNGAYHADLMRVVRIHIDGVRYFNKRLAAMQ